MLQSWKVKKGDRVVVITGKDKGKSGEITQVLRTDGRVVVSGINLQTKHQKPSMGNAGGLVRKEAPIHVSNVMLSDPKDDKPTRVGMKNLEDGRKVRYAKRSGEIIDK
ncbi:MAG: 50S ribosomal protein L24 [Caedibacter sp. 37-49]|nr:MAG: 50S ribosomal protein L24 [Caedibacter sp. 37-49]